MLHRWPVRNGQAARAELGVFRQQARAERGKWRECFSWLCARSKARAQTPRRPLRAKPAARARTAAQLQP
jgi:hypothetical protein